MSLKKLHRFKDKREMKCKYRVCLSLLNFLINYKDGEIRICFYHFTLWMHMYRPFSCKNLETYKNWASKYIMIFFIIETSRHVGRYILLPRVVPALELHFPVSFEDVARSGFGSRLPHNVGDSLATCHYKVYNF